jgi:hypothetical protein
MHEHTEAVDPAYEAPQIAERVSLEGQLIVISSNLPV